MRRGSDIDEGVFRGPDRGAMGASIVSLVIRYGGALVVLFALGFSGIGGWSGCMLTLAPLALALGVRWWAWQRVSVELADGVLRYEGVCTRDDFEVPLDRVTRAYSDRARAGRPLTLVLDDGAERALPGLDAASAEALRGVLVRAAARKRAHRCVAGARHSRGVEIRRSLRDLQAPSGTLAAGS